MRYQHLFSEIQNHSVDSPETAYARRKAAQWILAVCSTPFSMHSEMFDCIQWICGDLRSLLEGVERQTAGLRGRAEKDAHQAVKEVLGRSSRRYSGECDDLLDVHPCLRMCFAEQIQRMCREVSESDEMSSAESYSVARQELGRVFGIDEDCVAICEFIFIVQNFTEVESYFEYFLGVFKFGSRRLLAHMLGMSQGRLNYCLKELCRFGILESAHGSSLRLSGPILEFWSSERIDIDTLFSRPLSGEWLPLEAFRLPSEEVHHVCRLLKKKGTSPVHILLYGPSGTGKSTFVRSLAMACGVKAWSVISRDSDMDCDRRASLSACLHMASAHEGAFVVVDEAERLLDTDLAFGRQTKDKAWLNDFLERPGQRIVWISNQVEHIDPAVRRRFTYSIHFQELGVGERVEVWRQVMKRHGLSRRFQEPYMTALSRKYPVEAAVIQKAVSQSQSLYPDRDGFYSSLDRILKAHLVLQKGGDDRPEKSRSSVSDFTLRGVCMEGDVSAFMERCRRMDGAMRSGQKLRPGGATMLFYGPPGTGKTALARFIADSLNRECLVKRASDLLSPLVGVAEKQVAGSFQEAEKRGAVLVIDEADSFLYSRDGARHSWEVSLVNEFLTSLEDCNVFCICTTNRREQFDAAAMRRFSHKIRFRYADSAQVRSLYDTLLAPLCEEELPERLQQKLVAMTGLTPGDFHAVRSRYDPLFTDPGEVSHDLLIQALSQEAALKLEEQNRRMGFMG